jgi:hypothetical protein
MTGEQVIGRRETGGRATPASALYGLLGAPAVWSLHLLLSYLVVTLACDGLLRAPKVWLAGLTVAGALVAGAAGVRSHRANAGEHLERFLAVAGVLLSIVFVFGIVLTALALLILPPACR